MRALSKQRLEKMHAMLDKQLEREDEGLSSSLRVEQKQRQKNDFSHLRFTGNINLESQSLEQQKQKSKVQSAQKPSLFRKSLQKSFKEIQAPPKAKRSYINLSSSQQQQVREKQERGSLKGSRKNEINQLEKKLFDLEKKMQNIGISSDDEDNEDQKIQKPNKDKENKKINVLSKEESKKQLLKSLNLRENSYQVSKQKEPQSSRNEGTARFSGANRIEQINKRQKINIIKQSNLPLSHRSNTKSQSSDEQQFSTKYQKFVKVSRQSQKLLEKIQLKSNKKSQSSEEEDSSDQKIHLNKFSNKQIANQIQRLSIMKKDTPPIVSIQHKQSKDNNNYNPVYPTHNKEKQLKAKINTLQNLPERKVTTAEHQTLQPKYSIEKRNKSKSQSKKTIPATKPNLSNQIILSMKKQKGELKQRSRSIKKIELKQKSGSMKKIGVNLDNSFRSDKSGKSKKSVNSVRSLKSNKSQAGNYPNNNNTRQLQSIQQKKYIKKIGNLQKQLQHYKRLSKKYQTQLSTYKLMQIQYRKLQIQFKKSQQIRVQQKKIIENFRSKMINNV